MDNSKDIAENEAPIRRFALLIEFDGRPYNGWQKQNNGLSVQHIIEEAAEKLGRGPVVTATAGRTDSGVHAVAMSIHIDFQTDKDIDARAVRDGINFHLKPHPCSVIQAKEAPPPWHARFSATWRSYRYLILNRPARPAILMGKVWHKPLPIDVEALQESTRPLIGKHDFTSFRASACQAQSPIKTLSSFDISKVGDMIVCDVKARSFLHHQVRNMVGSIIENYERKRSPSFIKDILEAKDRKIAGITAPAWGLYFIQTGYDDDPYDPIEKPYFP